MIIFCSLHLSSVISIFICRPQIEEGSLKSCTLQNIHGVSVFNSTESRLGTLKKEITAVKWKQFADSESLYFASSCMIIFCSLLTEEDCNKLKASLDLNLNCRQTKLKKENKKEGKARFLPNAVLFFNCCI